MVECGVELGVQLDATGGDGAPLCSGTTVFKIGAADDVVHLRAGLRVSARLKWDIASAKSSFADEDSTEPIVRGERVFLIFNARLR